MGTETTVSYATVHLLRPEIMLVITAAWIYLAGAFQSTRRAMSLFAFAGLAFAAYVLFVESGRISSMQDAGVSGRLLGPVSFDQFSFAMRCLAVALGFLFIAFASRRRPVDAAPEVLASLLLVLAGLMLVAGASELVTLFLGLELISIPTYVLLFLGRRGSAAQEATVKYFFLSILSSAVLLYGLSLLYSVTGTTRLSEIYLRLADSSPSFPLRGLVPMAFLLIVGGLGFKIAAVPFHFYAPDVYEGTSYLNAGVLAVIPKVAGLVALIRVLAATMPGTSAIGWQVCLVLALLTMTLGNAVALWQSSLRRLLAYSSIAHTGYMLIGISVWMAAGSSGDAVAGSAGISATLLYLVVYVVASLGTFAALSYLSGSQEQFDKIDGLAGLSKTHRGSALMITIFMFSLMGLPPLAGFWGKLGLFAGALRLRSDDAGLLGYGSVQGWLLVLAVAGVLNAAVAAAYYLRVVAIMYFGSQEPALRRAGGPGAALTMGFCAAIAVLIGIYPGPLVKATEVLAPSAAVPVATEHTSARHQQTKVNTPEVARHGPLAR